MTFREFLNEQGTKLSVTGLNAGGRAGQFQFTPEKPVTKALNPNMRASELRKKNGFKGKKPKPVIPSSSFLFNKI